MRAIVLAASLVFLALGCGGDTGAGSTVDTAADAADASSDAVNDADAEISGDASGPALGPVFDQCIDGQAPDAACWASVRAPKSDTLALARRIADAALSRAAPETLAWDWGEAVLMLGIWEVHRVTGIARYGAYVRAWLDHHIEVGYEMWSSDSCAPAALAVAILRQGEDPRYRKVVDDALVYLREKALRTPEGGLNHLGVQSVLGVSLWADSLFMFGNVLTGWGEVSGDAEPLREYAEQYGIFASLMQEASGFFKHAAHSEFPQEDDVYWGRANGWIVAAAYDHLRVRRNRGERLPEMEASAKRLVDAALASQDAATGLWWTVPNRPGETYLETSASALFAFGMARGYRYGWLDATVLPSIERAMAGVRERIVSGDDGRPVITGTSGPTNVGPFDYYASVKVADDISYGVGAVLLALVETAGLLAEPADPRTEVPIIASPSFLARQAEYLTKCADASGPGTKASIYGQACRVATGLTTFQDAAFDEAIARLDDRLDTADFRAVGLTRLLYLDDTTGALGAERRKRVDDALLRFKYWLDEPGKDSMSYWTENHQILYHSAELLMGQRHLDDVFANDGKTGRQHVEHALPRLHRWLDLRGRLGFSEWHSNVYFNEDIPALLNLVDFAEDESIRQKARMVLDIMALDLLNNSYEGLFATTHGRTYSSKWLGGHRDSTAEYAWIALGQAPVRSYDNFAAAGLATSSYVPPALLEQMAADVAPTHEHRQRDSFDVAEGPRFGVSYAASLDDVVVWAGLAALAAPKVINGAMAIMEEFDLWDGFLFGSFPPALLNVLKSAVGTPELEAIAGELGPIVQGMALEAVDTYVYRTPDYQLAGGQDYKPGLWGAQTLMWRATLDADAFVLTVAPGGLALDSTDVNINDPWNGGWNPRVTLHKNVGVIQYHRGPMAPFLTSLVEGDRSHAYFPRAAFDEVQQVGHWTFGKKGEAYVALWSAVEPVWAAGNDYELVATGAENTWIVELGSQSESTSFEAFVAALTATTVEAGEGGVRYDSPSQGEVRVGWTGAMTVAGAAVDLGPYPRWDNAHQLTPRGTDQSTVRVGADVLETDFYTGKRRVMRDAAGR
ncbi:MAG: glycoside hydrolase family 88 protein [Myxococcota bacterium]